MNKNQQISFDVIASAVDGNERAMKKVLKHYDGYITKLSLRQMRDDYGGTYMVIDNELKGKIQNAVLLAITKFEIVVI